MNRVDELAIAQNDYVRLAGRSDPTRQIIDREFVAALPALFEVSPTNNELVRLNAFGHQCLRDLRAADVRRIAAEGRSDE